MSVLLMLQTTVARHKQLLADAIGAFKHMGFSTFSSPPAMAHAMPAAPPPMIATLAYINLASRHRDAHRRSRAP